MSATLFVDESGDPKVDERFVVGGVLTLGREAHEADDTLEQRAGNAYREAVGEQNAALRSAHATELTALGPKGFNALSQILLNAADAPASQDVLYFAVESPPLSSKEAKASIYRRLLVDLVALVLNVADHPSVESDLHLVLENLKEDRHNDITTLSDKRALASFFESIQFQATENLAALGFAVNLPQRTEIKKKNMSAGLAVADVLANRYFNRHTSEAGRLVRRLKNAGVLYTFESGPPSVRRATVAERDRDWALALIRWADLYEQAPEESERHMARIVTDLAAESSNALLKTIDAALERRYRVKKATAAWGDVAHFAERLGHALSTAAMPDRDSTRQACSVARFQAAAMGLLASNHLADASAAVGSAEVMRDLLPTLQASPETYSTVLGGLLRMQVAFEDQLQFEEARKQADKAFLSSKDAMMAWPYVFGQEEERPLPFRVRALMSSARAHLADPEGERALALERLNELEPAELSHRDRERWVSYNVWGRLRLGDYGSALDLATEWIPAALSGGLNPKGNAAPYAVATALRAAASAALADAKTHGAAAQSVLEKVDEYVRKSKDNGGLPQSQHPSQLIHRDLALLKGLFEWRKSDVAEHLRTSARVTHELGDALMADWLMVLLWDHARLLGYGDSIRKRAEKALRRLREATRADYLEGLGEAESREDLLRLRRRSVY